LSTKEIFAEDARDEGNPSRRLVIILLAVLSAACVLGAAAFFVARNRAARAGAPAPPPPAHEAQADEKGSADKSWKITGALTEACTCSVPCSCNFGEGPSPHAYCYPFYSYHIREGHYGDVVLDDLHFGSADLKNGRYMFVDERANERQREALRVIIARVIERAPADQAEQKAKELADKISYTKVEQEYDQRKNHLKVEGFGEFAADYVMGLDKSAPVVVHNNTTWRVRDSIKAKTSAYHVKVARDSVDTKGTNSNQGEFEYSSDMTFGGAVRWNCGQDANRAADGDGGEASCHK
jgi:hypothetical protein